MDKTPRVCAGAIGVLLLADLALMPWTGHLFDCAAFFRIADSVFFAHTPLTGNWSFGSLGLAAVLFSQLPVLFDPSLAAFHPARLFLLKLPSLICDIGTAAIIRWSCSEPAAANCWALRYLLDPVVLFTTVFHGQWDAIPNLFAVAGIALMAAGRYEYAGLALGLGTGTKFYPAVFVPLLAVAALRNGSLRRATASVGWFALTAVATLAPVFWGRLGYVFHSYAFNSFGPGQGVFTFSLWSLLPPELNLSTHAEQLIAVVIPLLLAAAELRHVPGRRDVARAAMLSVMSIVLLNPGAHPPFYLWVAGPLVLYAAIAQDGLAGVLGIVMSAAAVATQFCLEGADEYFLLAFGAGPRTRALSCLAPVAVLEWIILGCAAIIAVSCWREMDGKSNWRPWLRAVQATAVVGAAAFFSAAWISVASAAQLHRRPFNEGTLFDTLPVAPEVLRTAGGCRLTYNSYGSAAFARSAFAQRYVRASLGYTLFSPQTIDVRGRAIVVQDLPVRYEVADLIAYADGAVRVTQEYDITRLLQPIAIDEVMTQRPCGLVPKNPLLIYRFDLDGARAAAEQEPLLRRLNVFSQEVR